MIPQLHFNFGPTALDRFYQIALPLIPGAVFTVGLLAAHPGIRSLVRDAVGSGPYIDLAVLILMTYSAGFVLFAFSSIVTGIASGITQGLVFRRWTPTRWSWLLSQCTVWRKVAASFLGEELAPAIPETQPGSSVIEKIMAPVKQLGNKQQCDALWEEWYRILQDYVLRDVPIVSNDVAFVLVGVQATGWAGVALCLTNVHARHWFVYAPMSLFILFGALFPFLAMLAYLSTERLTYWDFTARLLAEVRSRGTQRRTTSQPSQTKNNAG